MINKSIHIIFVFLTLLIFSNLSIAQVTEQNAIPEDPAATIDSEITNSVDTENNLSTSTDHDPANTNDTNQEDNKILKPTGPTVGFVPEMAIEKYRDLKQDSEIEIENERLYQFAYQQQAKGLNTSAENAYKDILKTEPKHQKARVSLARLQIIDKRYQEAISNLNVICHDANSHWLAWYWKGLSELLNRQYDSAASSLQQVLIRDPENAAAWLLSALIEQERDDHHSALQLLSIAHQHEPDNATILLNMAISNEAIGNPKAAIEMYSRYLTLAPHSNHSKTLNQTVLKRLGEISIADKN